MNSIIIKTFVTKELLLFSIRENNNKNKNNNIFLIVVG